jgi:hypothetical protein
MPSVGIWNHVSLVRADVSEEHVAPIFREERIHKPGMLAVTSRLKLKMEMTLSYKTSVIMAHMVPHLRGQHSSELNKTTNTNSTTCSS